MIHPRAHRIEVDDCFGCPFLDVDTVTCEHPLSESRPYPERRIEGDGPPEWCPLRDSVTMIAGPRKT